MIYWIIPAGVVSLCYAVFKVFSRRKGLPVLMYHNVTDQAAPDALTVTTSQLHRQFEYIKKKGYTTIFLGDLLEHVYGGKPLPHKPLLITFDDGYKNNLTCLYPLLILHQLRANIFLIAGFIRHSNGAHGAQNNRFLTNEDIHGMSRDTVQFGLHSYDHASYNDLSIEAIDEDLLKSVTTLLRLGIPYEPCLAYTYGAFPKSDPVKRGQMFSLLQKHGVLLGFRIGNRLNELPLKNKYLIQRIDVKGNESFARFKNNLEHGRKLF